MNMIGLLKCHLQIPSHIIKEVTSKLENDKRTNLII